MSYKYIVHLANTVAHPCIFEFSNATIKGRVSFSISGFSDKKVFVNELPVTFYREVIDNISYNSSLKFRFLKITYTRFLKVLAKQLEIDIRISKWTEEVFSKYPNLEIIYAYIEEFTENYKLMSEEYHFDKKNIIFQIDEVISSLK